MATPQVSGTLLLTFTVLGWGVGWPVMKLLLVYWPPLFARGTTGVVAGMIILSLVAIRGGAWTVPFQQWGWIGLCALTNVFAWMGLPTIAMLWLSAGEGALLVYTFPIWVTLVACLIRKAWPSKAVLLAIILSISGLALLFNAPDIAMTPSRYLGFSLTLMGAVLFAVGVTCLQPRLTTSTLVGTGWQLLLGCGLMIIISLYIEHWDFGRVPSSAIGYLAYMTLIPMLLCYLSFFAALKLVNTTWASMFMLLTPVTGVLSGAVLLDEPLGARQVLAIALVLSGVWITLKRR